MSIPQPYHDKREIEDTGLRAYEGQKASIKVRANALFGCDIVPRRILDDLDSNSHRSAKVPSPRARRWEGDPHHMGMGMIGLWAHPPLSGAACVRRADRRNAPGHLAASQVPRRQAR